MRLDLAKIDDRIKKLQEVRRIASDPEMAPPPVPVDAVGDNGATRSGDDVNQLVKGVLDGTRWDKRV